MGRIRAFCADLASGCRTVCRCRLSSGDSMASQETRLRVNRTGRGRLVDRLHDQAAGVEGPTMGGGWPRTCPFLRLGKLVVALRAGPSTGCGVQGVEKAFDTGQSGGGLLGSIAVVQHPKVRFTLRRISTAVLQAALMKRLCKPIETSRSVMHRKTGVVLSQNRRRLGIPTMRFNHVNGDLFAQQHPQILRTCAYSPAGVVQPYHGALPQGALQLLVGGRRQIPQSRQGPAYPTPA